MADCALVVSSFTDLREALSALAIRTVDADDRNVLLHRAAVSGSLAEECDGKFSGREVPGGRAAIDKATPATALAGLASGQDREAARKVIDAAGQANATLAQILGNNNFAASAADALVGSLRITPPKRAAARAGGGLATAAAGKSRPATPGYVTDVAKLFPVEAATLFPLGQAVAQGSQALLILIIVACALFVVALRFFATQEDGEPAWNEIGGALISFLLWVGATRGYWVEKGGFAIGVGPDQGAALFGFFTIMWVALAPYFVREKSKHDADRAATSQKAGSGALRA